MMSEPGRDNLVEKKIRSALPLYIAAGVFVLAALALPVYRLWGLLVCAALSAAAWAVAEKRIPPRTVLVPAPAPVYATGEAALDAVLQKAAADLQSLAQLNARIPDEELSAAITRMEKAGRAILREVEHEPDKARSIRKFASYYLPTAVKILTAYAELSASGAAGHNVRSLMEEVERNADIIATAFETQLDALFAGEVLDVSSDIAVLESMAGGDGLKGQALSGDGPTLSL